MYSGLEFHSIIIDLKCVRFYDNNWHDDGSVIPSLSKFNLKKSKHYNDHIFRCADHFQIWIGSVLRIFSFEPPKFQHF